MRRGEKALSCRVGGPVRAQTNLLQLFQELRALRDNSHAFNRLKRHVPPPSFPSPLVLKPTAAIVP